MYLATHESVTVARGQRQENTDRVRNKSDCKIRYRSLSKKNNALFPMLSILDILLFSISYIQQILANCPPFINLPEASRCCVSFEEHISLCKLAKIRKYNETFNSKSIICLLHAFHHKKHDFFLTLPILNIQVEKEKEKRGPSTVPHPMHSSSSNTSN